MRRGLGDPALPRVAPHVTLVPPVNVREAAVHDVVEVLRNAAASGRPFKMTLGPPDTFHPDSPVVYLPLEVGADEVGRLRDAVFVGPLARDLTWPFVPHVTLADEMRPDRIPAALAALSSYRAELTVERLHLLQEARSRVWRTVGDFPLAAPAVVGRGGLALELSLVQEPDPEARTWAASVWASRDAAGEPGAPAWPPARPFAVVARRGSSVVGMVEGRCRGKDCDVDRVIVDPSARGEGVGTAMLQAVESDAAAAGCERCRLETPAAGRARRFFEGRGFRVTGNLEDWRGGVDYVRMERALALITRTR